MKLLLKLTWLAAVAAPAGWTQTQLHLPSQARAIPARFINDLAVSAAANVATVEGGRIRFGEQAYTLATSTFTFSGSGSARVFVTSGGNLFCQGTTGLSAIASGSGTFVTAPAASYPAGSVPVASLTVTGGIVTVDADDRVFISQNPVMAGLGIAVSQAAGLASVAVDTAVIPTLAGANAWIGENNFGTATRTFPSRMVTADPPTCTVGESIYNTTTNVRKDCTSTNVFTAPSGGGGGGVGDVLGAAGLTRVGAIPFVSGNGTLAQDSQTQFSRGVLRNTRERLASIRRNNPANSVLNVAFIGDSTVTAGYVDGVARALYESFGFAGAGYVSANQACTPVVTGIGVTVTLGTWTGSNGQTMGQLNGCHAQNVDTTSLLQVSGSFTEASIQFLNMTGGGTFQYRVDGGAYTSQSTNAATSVGIVNITGLTYGQHTIDIQATSGTVRVIGWNLRRNTHGGARVHKIAVGGYATATYLSYTESNWNAALANLSPDVCVIGLGLNDLGASVLPATYRTNMESLANRCLAANPLADVVLFAQNDDGRTGLPFTMTQYRDQILSSSVSNGYGFFDVQQVLGNYAQANARGLMNDPTHPGNSGYQIANDATFTYLTGGIPNRAQRTPSYNEFQNTINASQGWALYGNGISPNISSTGATAIGVGAGAALTNGTGFTGVGRNAGAAAVSAQGITAVGHGAADVATGNFITAFGNDACGATTTNAHITCLGYQAGLVSTGAANTFIGSMTGNAVTTGQRVTAVGFQAGVGANNITTDSYVTMLGASTAKGSATARSYLTVVGAEATGDCSNCVVLGRAGDLTQVPSGTIVLGASVTASPLWRTGSGNPEGVVTAPVGSMFTRTDGGAGSTLYVKESGTGSTGWVAK